MTIPIEPDVQEAIDFLERMLPGGPWVVMAIPPDGGRTQTSTFQADEGEQLEKWIRARSGVFNLYWMVNPARGALSSKAAKEDVKELASLQVDIDPGKREGLSEADQKEWIASERARILDSLRAYSPKPSVIVDSGGGYQAFWPLSNRLYLGGNAEQISKAEAYNRQLSIALGGDSCWSIDHVMRLPGTINVPGKKKRQRGRIEALARVVEMGEGSFNISDFTAAPLAQRRVSKAAPNAKISSELPRLRLDQLPATVNDRIKTLIIHGCDPEKPEKYPSRSEPLLAVCCALVRAGCDDDTIAAIILDPDYKISGSVRDRGSSARQYASKQIESARGKVGSVRPRVVYNESELPSVLDQAEAALMMGEVPLYQQAGRLVHPVRLDASETDGGVRREAGALLIRDVSHHRLREYMLQSTHFVRVTASRQGNADVPFAPKVEFARHYAAREGAWRLPVLRGVSETPTLRRDGTIIDTEGFDRASGLIVDTEGIKFPTPPDRPTREDALSSLAQLREVIKGFPFVPDAAGKTPGPEEPSSSRSVALSCILTAVSRKAMRTAPLHGLSAPTMGTGKSLLADVAAMIATGRPAPVMSQGAREEEDEKRLFSVLMQGDPVVAIDNIERPVSGDALCSILTQETWQSRWLGQNRMVRVSTNTLLIANGNNLEFKGDMSTRVIVARLDAGVEAPEKRRFDIDLKNYVPLHRPRLVVAALTVLRAFVVAGRPGLTDLEPFGRFEEWSDLVRGALVWLGEPDPVGTRTLVAERDGFRVDHAALLHGWKQTIGVGKYKTAAEVIESAQAEERVNNGHSDLSVALGAVSPRGVTPKSLGHFLSKVADRWVDDMRLVAQQDKKRGNSYRMETKQDQRLLGV